MNLNPANAATAAAAAVAAAPPFRRRTRACAANCASLSISAPPHLRGRGHVRLLYSRQAAAVHPLNKHANECLFYISVTFCPGESSYSPTATPTVRPSGRATRTHVPVPHRDVTVRRLFLFFFLGGAKWCRRAPLHLQPPRTTSPHALFISVHGFVIDSFFYPVAAIFHMAYLDAAPPRG